MLLLILCRANPTFNKEVYVDFVAAQIKTLSFLAYIIRIYQEQINVHAAQMVKGMLGLLTFCPQEVAHLRKELLIAARHILATDLRSSMTLLVCYYVVTIIIIIITRVAVWPKYDNKFPQVINKHYGYQ